MRSLGLDIYNPEYIHKTTLYRPFTVGQDAAIIENCMLGRYIKSYFPESGGRVKILAVSVFDESIKHDYVVRPHCCKDTLEVSHWHIRPVDLVETRLFAPIGLIIPGVTVKMINSGNMVRIMRHDKNATISDDNKRLNKSNIAVIMTERWDRPILETLVRAL
jgi:hypothetical protein